MKLYVLFQRCFHLITVLNIRRKIFAFYLLSFFLGTHILYALPPFQTYKNEIETKKILQEYIHRRDHNFDDYYEMHHFPMQLDPKTVEQVLREEIKDPTLSIFAATNIVNVAHVYNSKGLIPDVMDKVKQAKPTTDVKTMKIWGLWLSCIGYLGDTKQSLHLGSFTSPFSWRESKDHPAVRMVYGDTEWAFARNGFDKWLEAMTLKHDISDAVSVYDAFTPAPTSSFARLDEPFVSGQDFVVTENLLERTNLQSLRQALITQKSRIAAQKAQSHETRRDINIIDDLLLNNVERLFAATMIKRELLKEPLSTQLDHLVLLYLTLDARYHEYLGGSWPAIQLLRQAQAGKVKEVIAALRRGLKNISSLPSSTDHFYRDYLRTMALTAIEFFGGTLSKLEQDMIRKNKQTVQELLVARED